MCAEMKVRTVPSRLPLAHSQGMDCKSDLAAVGRARCGAHVHVCSDAVQSCCPVNQIFCQDPPVSGSVARMFTCAFFFFFFTLVTGPRRSLSLKLGDTMVYEPVHVCGWREVWGAPHLPWASVWVARCAQC